jgi:sec-independent protein translocase protein TatA
MPFGLHWETLIPLLLLALLVFGAKRLPEIGSAAGQTIKSFQKAMREGQDPAEGQQALPPPSDEQTTPRP